MSLDTSKGSLELITKRFTTKFGAPLDQLVVKLGNANKEFIMLSKQLEATAQRLGYLNSILNRTAAYDNSELIIRQCSGEQSLEFKRSVFRFPDETLTTIINALAEGELTALANQWDKVKTLYETFSKNWETMVDPLIEEKDELSTIVP